MASFLLSLFALAAASSGAASSNPVTSHKIYIKFLSPPSSAPTTGHARAAREMPSSALLAGWLCSASALSLVLTPDLRSGGDFGVRIDASPGKGFGAFAHAF